jgi:hypothetical protein
MRPAPRHLDAFELEGVQRSVGRRLLLEDASCVEQADGWEDKLKWDRA